MDEIEKNASTEQLEKPAALLNTSGDKRVDIGILLALFLGFFGAHHFYLGKWKMGIAYLVLGSLTLLSIPLALFDCFRMKGLVARANNTQSPSVGTMATQQAAMPLASGVSKENVLFGMPAKYVLGFAGVLGGLLVLMIAVTSIYSMMGAGKIRKEFEQNRDEIVAVAQKALDDGDFNKVKSIGLKHRMAHDPELEKILSTAKNRLSAKKAKLAEKLNQARGNIFPFKLVEYSDSSFLGRKRCTWFIVLEGNFQPQDVRATAISVAKEMVRKPFLTEVATVCVRMHEKDEEWIAKIEYIPDGWGYGGEARETKSDIWDIEVQDSIPTLDEVKVNMLFFGNVETFRNQDKNSSDYLLLDEKRLKLFVAEKMKITTEEVSRLLLMYKFKDEKNSPKKRFPKYRDESFTLTSGFTAKDFQKRIKDASLIVDKSNRNEFIKYLRENNLVSVIENVASRGMDIKIKVRNAWHYEPKQTRLLISQQFWKQWMMIVSPSNQDSARITIIDLNRNEVGGSRAIGGSVIWVKD